MSRQTLSPRAQPLYVACLALWAVVTALALAGCSLDGPSAGKGVQGRSAEFSELESGQGRFATSETNLDSCVVIVDRSTGVQYLLYGEGQGYGSTSWSYTGLCPLLDADGRPLLVEEAER